MSERLAGLLEALACDCENTDGWEDAAPTCHEAAAALRSAAAREAALVEALEEIGQYTITCSMMSTNASSFIMGKVSAALAAAKGDAP
jgi:hypothetical protein